MTVCIHELGPAGSAFDGGVWLWKSNPSVNGTQFLGFLFSDCC